MVIWWGIRFAILPVLFAAVRVMPEKLGWETIWVALAYLAIHSLINRGLLLRCLRLGKLLKVAGQRLQTIADATVASMGGVRLRAVWELEGNLTNAFAFPMSRELVFGKRLLEICNDEEIAAICAHEIAHLKESKVVLFGRWLGALAFFPLIFIPPLTSAFALWGLCLSALLMFGLMQFARILSQRQERQADEFAFKGQTNEGVYARALEKLYQENRLPAVNVNNRQTHPHLYDRMIAAGITPDFPRPFPPKRLTWLGWVVILTFIFTTVLALIAQARLDQH